MINRRPISLAIDSGDVVVIDCLERLTEEEEAQLLAAGRVLRDFTEKFHTFLVQVGPERNVCDGQPGGGSR